MKIAVIEELDGLIAKTRAAEAALAKVREAKDQAAAKYAAAESLTFTSAVSADEIDQLASKLTASRRGIEDLDKQIVLHERNLTLQYALLRNRGVNIFGLARDRFDALRASVQVELQRRLAAFLPPQNFRRTIPESSLLPLEKPRGLFLSMEAIVSQLRDQPVEASLRLSAKFQALLEESAAAERDLGIH